MNNRNLAIKISKHPLLRKLSEDKKIPKSILARLIVEEMMSEMAGADPVQNVRAKVKSWTTGNIGKGTAKAIIIDALTNPENARHKKWMKQIEVASQEDPQLRQRMLDKFKSTVEEMMNIVEKLPEPEQAEPKSSEEENSALPGIPEEALQKYKNTQLFQAMENEEDQKAVLYLLHFYVNPSLSENEERLLSNQEKKVIVPVLKRIQKVDKTMANRLLEIVSKNSELVVQAFREISGASNEPAEEPATEPTAEPEPQPTSEPETAPEAEEEIEDEEEEIEDEEEEKEEIEGGEEEEDGEKTDPLPEEIEEKKKQGYIDASTKFQNDFYDQEYRIDQANLIGAVIDAISSIYDNPNKVRAFGRVPSEEQNLQENDETIQASEDEIRNLRIDFRSLLSRINTAKSELDKFEKAKTTGSVVTDNYKKEFLRILKRIQASIKTIHNSLQVIIGDKFSINEQVTKEDIIQQWKEVQDKYDKAVQSSASLRELMAGTESSEKPELIIQDTYSSLLDLATHFPSVNPFGSSEVKTKEDMNKYKDAFENAVGKVKTDLQNVLSLMKVGRTGKATLQSALNGLEDFSGSVQSIFGVPSQFAEIRVDNQTPAAEGETAEVEVEGDSDEDWMHSDDDEDLSQLEYESELDATEANKIRDNIEKFLKFIKRVHDDWLQGKFNDRQQEIQESMVSRIKRAFSRKTSDSEFFSSLLKQLTPEVQNNIGYAANALLYHVGLDDNIESVEEAIKVLWDWGSDENKYLHTQGQKYQSWLNSHRERKEILKAYKIPIFSKNFFNPSLKGKGIKQMISVVFSDKNENAKDDGDGQESYDDEEVPEQENNETEEFLEKIEKDHKREFVEQFMQPKQTDIEVFFKFYKFIHTNKLINENVDIAEVPEFIFQLIEKNGVKQFLNSLSTGGEKMIFNSVLKEIKEDNNTEKFINVMKQKPADYFKDGSFQVLGAGDGQESEDGDPAEQTPSEEDFGFSFLDLPAGGKEETPEEEEQDSKTSTTDTLENELQQEYKKQTGIEFDTDEIKELEALINFHSQLNETEEKTFKTILGDKNYNKYKRKINNYIESLSSQRYMKLKSAFEKAKNSNEFNEFFKKRFMKNVADVPERIKDPKLSEPAEGKVYCPNLHANRFILPVGYEFQLEKEEDFTCDSCDKNFSVPVEVLFYEDGTELASLRIRHQSVSGLGLYSSWDQFIQDVKHFGQPLEDSDPISAFGEEWKPAVEHPELEQFFQNEPKKTKNQRKQNPPPPGYKPPDFHDRDPVEEKISRKIKPLIREMLNKGK